MLEAGDEGQGCPTGKGGQDDREVDDRVGLEELALLL